MRTDADPLDLSPEQRYQQLAKLLAAGVLRLLGHGPYATAADAEKSRQSDQNSLEVSDALRLSGHTS